MIPLNFNIQTILSYTGEAKEGANKYPPQRK